MSRSTSTTPRMADSASMEFEDSDVIEIIPADEYDTQRAKLKASVSWILSKAYGSNIPPDLKDPFYENAKGQLQVKPQLINLMTSSDLYCQACSNMFSDTASHWQGHWSIIQVLSRKGIYVAEAGDTTVTETVLMHTAPFKVAAHLALIDALMKAYVSEIASVERIAQAVRRYASFSASSELPSNSEEALIFWVNKTCTALVQRGDLEIIQGESSQKVRIVSKTTPREPKNIPVLKDLMGDVGDGCCVAATISFYQPDALPVTDVCLKENVGIADSLYNLRLIRTFCERHLVLKCFHFTYEDLLYGKENLRENVLAFLAELFFLLEAAQQGDAKKVVPSEGVTQVSVRHMPSPSIPAVSNVTKRSFQKAADDGRHHLDKISTSPTMLSTRQPLLQKRTSSRRSQSLSLPQERDTIRRSVLAWQDDQDIRDRTSHSTLLENVSMSWDADTTGDSDLDPVSSADLAEFEATGQPQSQRSNLTDPNHPEYMEVVSVTPGQAASARSSVSNISTGRHEPLMPAKLRPAKEKINNHSKAEERGDRTPRKKVVSPTKPTKGKLSPPGSGTSHGRVSPAAGSRAGGGGGVGESPRSSGSSMDETLVTPLASVEMATVHSDDTVSSSDASTATTTAQSLQQQQQQQQTRPASRTGYEAFVIGPDSSEISILSPRRTVTCRAGSQGDKPTVSYTLESNIHDSQTAREAGLPVVGRSSGDVPADAEVASRYIGVSREGSVGSSRSSGDFSDHESHKIHQDHKARESLKHSPRQVSESHKAHSQASDHHSPHLGVTSKPGQLIMDHLPGNNEGQKKPGTTSFAEIRRLKGVGKVDNSGLVYMQQGQEQGGDASGQANRVSLKSTFMQKADGRKAPYTRLPHETTWQQSAQRQAAQAASSSGDPESSLNNGDRPATSELSQLRLKLEEKRREIERKKQRQEVQTAKMRQRLGKAAFMRVISKKDEGEGGPGIAFSAPPGLSVWRGDGADHVTSNHSPPTHALLQERLGQVAPDEPSRPTSLATISPASSNSTSASVSPSAAGRFSREGTQQTDGVRRRWFHGSDPEGDLINSRDVMDDASGIPVSELSCSMMQSCPPSMAAEAFGYAPSSSLGQEARASPVLKDTGPAQEGDVVSALSSMRERSQSPHETLEQRVSGSGEQEDYDQSLDKLNRSLTELQGEIRRLSLQQQEQFRSSQSSPQPDPSLVPSQDQTPQPPSSSKTHHSARSSVHHSSIPANLSTHLASASLVPGPSPPSSSSSLHPHPTPPPSQPEIDVSSQDDDSSGFFVSLGEDTPRRSKPRLGKERDGVGKKDSSDITHGGGTEAIKVQPVHGGVALAAGGELGSSHSGSHHSLQSGSDDSSSGVGFVLGQESVDTTKDTEMQKKKEWLMQQQMKRREEQERKRLQKELETQRRQEQKMLKEEEQEKKKAEEKARREAIFQQYLQKKMDQDDDRSPGAPSAAHTPTSAGVTRRERSGGGHPRPKSMFAKARPLLSEMDEVSSARGLASHSSQEDLSSHTSPTGSTAPLSPFRLNPNSRGKIRKAVSCNQLTQNGSQGASTYRRPASPGPKLFVKPSSKSNRHIIINALSYCCLAGIVNTDMKNKVLEEIARSAAKHFLILFRDHGCQYRGLYSFDPDTDEAYKIVGIGPRQLTSDMVERFYKYNSGGKSFNEVTSTKHLSVSIDAIVLQNVYWKSKASSAARR